MEEAEVEAMSILLLLAATRPLRVVWSELAGCPRGPARRWFSVSNTPTIGVAKGGENYRSHRSLST
jgi:hypothetical protein